MSTARSSKKWAYRPTACRWWWLRSSRPPRTATLSSALPQKSNFLTEPQPVNSDSSLSVVHGQPLSEETGQGALTIPGYLREVTGRYFDREAVVLNCPEGVVRWS